MTRYSKLIVALVGAATEAVALGLFDAKILAIVVAFLTAGGVYQATNEPPSVNVLERLRGYGDRAQSAVNVLLIVLLVIVILVVLGII